MITSKTEYTSYRHIWRLSWPVMASNISLPLVGAVDVAMMGHLPDAAFVGGVALGGLVFNFLYLTFAFLRMGTTGLTALAAGAGKEDEVASVFIRGHLIAFICGFGIIICLPAILWLATLVLTASADSLGHMQTYLQIRIWGLPATLANAVMLGSLFGLQKMRLCMVQLLTINLLNILLNLFLVLGLGWQVAGVALASVCAEWTGLGLMIVIVLHPSQPMVHKIRALSCEQFKNRAEWSKLMAIAKNLSLRTLLIWTVEALLIAQAARLGDVELASIQIILVLFSFIAFGLDGFAHATEALTGQMVGNHNPSDLRIMIRKSCFLAGLTAALISFMLFLFQPIILPLMTSQPELLQLTSDMWIWVLAIPLSAFLAFQMDGVFVGAASTLHMRNGMIIAFAVFTGLVSLLSAGFFKAYHLDGLMFAFILYLTIRGIYLFACLPSVISLAQSSGSMD